MSLPGLSENVEDANWLHLTDGEIVHWTGRPSVFTITLKLAIAVGIAVIGIVLTIWFTPLIGRNDLPQLLGYLPLVLTIGGILSAISTYLNWIRLRYVITSEEICVKQGLVSRDVTQVRLNRVQNTAFSQSVVERALSYGDIKIYTAGTSTDDLLFRSVPQPEQVTKILTQLLSEYNQNDDL